MDKCGRKGCGYCNPLPLADDGPWALPTREPEKPALQHLCTKCGYVTVDQPFDRQAIALEKIADSLEKLANPMRVVDTRPLPARSERRYDR